METGDTKDEFLVDNKHNFKKKNLSRSTKRDKSPKNETFFKEILTRVTSTKTQEVLQVTYTFNYIK